MHSQPVILLIIAETTEFGELLWGEASRYIVIECTEKKRLGLATDTFGKDGADGSVLNFL